MLFPNFRLPYFPQVFGLDFLRGELDLNKKVYCAKDLNFAKRPTDFRGKKYESFLTKVILSKSFTLIPIPHSEKTAFFSDPSDIEGNFRFASQDSNYHDFFHVKLTFQMSLMKQ